MFPVNGNMNEMLYGAIAEEDDVIEEEVIEEESTDETEEVDTDNKDETVDDVDVPNEGEKNEKEDNDLNFEIEEEQKKEQKDELDITIPEKFESVEEERDFYKKNFTKYKDTASNPEVIATKYEEELLAKEKDVEELKALRDALKGQPDAFVKMRFKEQLVKGGYDHRLSEQEQVKIIDTEMSKIWGNNYRDIFDPEDQDVPGTLSYNMVQKQNEILNGISKYNEVPQQEQVQQIDPEEARKTVHESLSKVGVKDENIDRFIEDLKTSDLLNDPVKLYKAVYADKLYSKKIAQAREEGRKEALAQISKAGNKPVEEQDDSKEKKEIDYNRRY